MTNPERGPLIGITARHKTGKVKFFVPRHYSEAIYAAGGLPVLIPLIDSPDYLDQILQKLDGILFCGSENDVEPRHYGQDPLPGLGPVDPLQDSVDLYLAGGALQSRMPVLAVCYGFQMLNVKMGGTLVQDLPSMRSASVEHRGLGDAVSQHSVSLAAGTILETLAQATEVQVNSSHHQAVDRLAADLAPVATAPDGVIEAAVHRKGYPVLGVQWHPEKNFKEDALSLRLFVHFVTECESFRTAKNAKRHHREVAKGAKN